MFEKLFLNRRVVTELKLQRQALERIATCLEEIVLRDGKVTGTGLRSLYRGEEDGEVLMQTDEDLAGLEALEKERERVGGETSIDDDLEGEWR